MLTIVIVSALLICLQANFSIDPDLILPYNNTPVTPILRICVIPDSAATTMTNAMNELTSLELANLDAIESDTLVFTVNHLLDKYSIRHYPANKKEIIANPPLFSVLSIDCGIWSYEMTENGQIRSALKKQERKKTCCCRFNKSKYGLRHYYVW